MNYLVSLAVLSLAIHCSLCQDFDGDDEFGDFGDFGDDDFDFETTPDGAEKPTTKPPKNTKTTESKTAATTKPPKNSKPAGSTPATTEKPKNGKTPKEPTAGSTKEPPAEDKPCKTDYYYLAEQPKMLKLATPLEYKNYQSEQDRLDLQKFINEQLQRFCFRFLKHPEDLFSNVVLSESELERRRKGGKDLIFDRVDVAVRENNWKPCVEFLEDCERLGCHLNDKQSQRSTFTVEPCPPL